MDKNTIEIRRRNWAAIIRDCNASGIAKRTWCAQNGISVKSYYYWQKKFRQEAFETQSSLALSASPLTFAEVPLCPSSTKNTERIPSAIFQPDLIIRTSTLTIEVSNNISNEMLSLLGMVLNNAT